MVQDIIEKLIVTQLVKNILLSYGTRRFITVFTQARQLTTMEKVFPVHVFHDEFPFVSLQ
jgi:hypothetical protein